jgi:hypothetical protein
MQKIFNNFFLSSILQEERVLDHVHRDLGFVASVSKVYPKKFLKNVLFLSVLFERVLS